MTRLLEKAFKKASRLSEIEQNMLAKWLLKELEAEKQWDQSLAGSEHILDRLADEALAAHKRGKTTPLDVCKL